MSHNIHEPNHAGDCIFCGKHVGKSYKMASSAQANPTDTNQASKYQGNEPTYRVDEEKGKYVVRKFVEFDHSWAIYSKPLDTFDTIHGAKEYIRLLELEAEL